MKKRLFALLVAGMVGLSVPFTVSASWKQDSQQNWSWVENGKKATGWKKIGNYWYYFDGNGKMVTGWRKVNGKWYYLSSSGAMLTNSFTPDNYWVDNNGVWPERASKSIFNEDINAVSVSLLHFRKYILENKIEALRSRMKACQAVVDGDISTAYNEIQNTIVGYKITEEKIEQEISYASQFKELQVYTDILDKELEYLRNDMIGLNAISKNDSGLDLLLKEDSVYSQLCFEQSQIAHDYLLDFFYKNCPNVSEDLLS